MTATSTEQSTASSWAFLKSPPLRFRKVTERLRSSLIALISIFLRPIDDYRGVATKESGWGVDNGEGKRTGTRVDPEGDESRHGTRKEPVFAVMFSGFPYPDFLPSVFSLASLIDLILEREEGWRRGRNSEGK